MYHIPQKRGKFGLTTFYKGFS
ncbi:hypothetical protein NITGR_170062 [Nitrospina gracilis 3/211]|uniref:Uncharacterized protein n=1 Tax=Nitrospina gracilis (strain 3/211) TaxID=1266370 RepID=M1YVY5_NITG3|nr:hypothetical protein NITGR_170062 [Nitrospina gracilis 3/211]